MATISGPVKNINFAMFLRNFHTIFRRIQINTSINKQNFTAATSENVDEADPAPVFLNPEVQKVLKVLTRPDVNRIFRLRKEGKTISDPEYRFMTDEELKVSLEKAYKKIDEKLQMPPVVKKRKPITSILSNDPALQGHDTAKYVFTDITFGISNQNRLIVIRDVDGKLRHADWDERKRMNQIYFPIEGREFRVPRMFQGEYFDDLLKRHEYEYLLDRACLQFDPDDPEFHRINEAIYKHLNEFSLFSKLRSTRHYGPLIFHLVWTKNIDNLLLENITNGMIEDAVLLIQLYNQINPTSKAADVKHDGDDIKYIQQYAEKESPIRGKLTAAIQAYKELEQARKNVEEGVKKAHGIK